jgi:glycosyltransferase involved in cell wall biosynthesis
MRYVLLGDGQSPHLLKWARALQPRAELWVASSRDFDAGFDALVPPARRLALNTRPDAAGGNFGVLRKLPALVRWLRGVRADVVHAHYLTSHGTLAWLATTVFGAPGRLVGSAWGSDILVTPVRSAIARALTRRVLRHCVLATSDSQAMTQAMQALGAGEVMTFPFGLEAMPPLPGPKQPQLFYANRGLEPVYAPLRVIDTFTAIARHWPQAQLVVANEGSLRAAAQAHAAALPQGVAQRVRFVGRLSPAEQAAWYAQAQWFISLPVSDSVSVSVLEAMAHGCVPVLSDLPANRELVHDRDNGLIVADGRLPDMPVLSALLQRAAAIGEDNRAWVAANALFAPSVDLFLGRLRELLASPAAPRPPAAAAAGGAAR